MKIHYNNIFFIDIKIVYTTFCMQMPMSKCLKHDKLNRRQFEN